MWKSWETLILSWAEALLLGAGNLFSPGANAAPTLPPGGLTAGSIIAWYPAPRTALAGDVDGDSRADFVGFYPPDNGIIDVMRTSALGKLCFPVQACKGFGSDGLTAVVGDFAGSGKVGVLVVLPDGAVRILHDWRPRDQSFARNDLAATLPSDKLPKSPVKSVAGDFDGDGWRDALWVDAEGRMLLLHNAGAGKGSPQFEPRPVAGLWPHLRRLAAGRLGGLGKAELVWLDRGGGVYRAALQRRPDGSFRLDTPHLVTIASPEAGLAVGHFRGLPRADLLVGDQLLPGGNARQALFLPNLSVDRPGQGDYAWIAADFDGDGQDDLLRAQRSGDRFDGDHVYLHYAFQGSEVEGAPFADADRDGLLNAWETGRMKPGGLDLKALGCTPCHRDLIVELQRFADVPEDKLRSEMERVVKYFAALPIQNPDGRPGLALHVLYREAMPVEEVKKPWWELGEKYHPAAHRGITHWMQVSMGGGGQSGEMADRGSCGFHAFYATFLHEFGHQIGLDHTGHWGPAWCPIYPSLMNYAYNYQSNGKGEDIHYSDGRLAAVVLHERNLSERLPWPPDQVAFLSGPPYRYRLQPAPDGSGTWIDWNWNGVFGEEGIAADINYGYSTTGGQRHTIGKTYTAPALAATGEGEAARLLLFCGQLPEGAAVPPADATALHPSLSADQPGRLVLRLWEGTDPESEADKWSEEIPVEPSEVTGDPSAASLAGAAWVAYPTLAGVKIRRILLDPSGTPHLGEASLILESQRVQPTLTPFAGGLALLLWRSPQTPVGFRLLTVQDGTVQAGPETALEFTSTLPVGAVAGAVEGEGPSLWVGLTQDQDEGRPNRWQVRRLVLTREGLLRQVHQEWIGGEKGGERGSSRVLLLWEPNEALGPEGQLYFLAGGLFGSGSPWSCHYIAMRIADKTINGGWLTRRYYDEWTQSRSAPGACFFRGDIALAVRWFGNVHGTENDNLFVAFRGRGIESEPMGDFDDLRFICDYGLVRSIPHMAR